MISSESNTFINTSIIEVIVIIVISTIIIVGFIIVIMIFIFNTFTSIINNIGVTVIVIIKLMIRSIIGHY